MTASDDAPVNMTGGCWGIAETTFKVLPTFEDGASEAWLNWTAEQTAQMTTGRKKLRLKFTQANGQVKVFPDVFIAVQ
jgi:hypothetical protein